MKLHEKLPGGVIVRGHFYRLDFDFRNVLRMMETMARDDLLPEARDYLALGCLMRRPPKKRVADILAAIREILFPETRKNPDAKKITDFAQDADLIRAAFLQCYGINLFRDRLHWMEFSSLLAGLPDGNRYSEVLGIRARPMPAPTKWNQEERRWLAKAKAEYAVHLNDAEKRESLENSLRSVAMSLLALAEKGGCEHA
jgi:hypothetical protein